MFSGEQAREVVVYVYAPISRYGVALLRVVVGVIFIWAGVGKMFNDGAPGAWTAKSFLKFATNGTLGWPFVNGTPDPKTIYNPTHDFWVSLANNDVAMTITNNLVVSGEVLIGVALILGIVTRFAGVMGALMMAGMGAGNYYGLDRVLSSRFPVWFRNFFMSGDPNPPVEVSAPSGGAGI